MMMITMILIMIMEMMMTMMTDCFAGFHPSTLLQPVNGSKNLILKLNLFKHFFACSSRKTLDGYSILLHHCFYYYKPQILTKQTGLTNRLAILRKNLCSCVQRVKKKHSGADIAFLISACCSQPSGEDSCQVPSVTWQQRQKPWESA